MALHAGTTLGGRYVLEALIATGGMGEVWRGEDTELVRPVAIKLLKEGAAANDIFLKRFHNEAKNAAGLMHHNIAQVFDYGDYDGTAYLVMELVEGEPLSSILEREHTLDERRLISMLIYTCRGLQAAHAAGVMHRDIKPGNLLVDPGDVIKITDFGVSRSADQTALTATGMVMGTAQYLAPELALGKPATPASDLYAMGIIAYEAVVGKRPFTAKSAVDIAIAQVNEDVPHLPPTVSPDLASLIMRLLEKNPRKRPSTARELEQLLERVKVRDDAPTPVPAQAPGSITPRERPRSAGRSMPPSIAPRAYRPRPTSPRGRV
ncbi:MAG: serine/threonine protein kinase [Actinobacteria bacterium HGW-Actinobacteria-4]|nr:MAG: serine/threonine protein kinase [Actinobacteria bacterium HGW-Actinobacteria-4]